MIHNDANHFIVGCLRSSSCHLCCMFGVWQVIVSDSFPVYPKSVCVATVRLVWPIWPQPPPLRINLARIIIVACSHWFLLGFVTALNNAWVARKSLLGKNTDWGNILSFLRGGFFRGSFESVAPVAGVESFLSYVLLSGVTRSVQNYGNLAPHLLPCMLLNNATYCVWCWKCKIFSSSQTLTGFICDLFSAHTWRFSKPCEEILERLFTSPLPSTL